MREMIWTFMDVMYAGTRAECRLLEIALISRLGPIPGCYNTRPGGEGISASGGASAPLCYCYTVFSPAGHGKGLQAQWLSSMTGRLPDVREKEQHRLARKEMASSAWIHIVRGRCHTW